MYLMGIKVDLYLFSVHSLKEKRRIIRSILDHVKNRYKISAAEVDFLDSLDYGSVGFGVVSNNIKQAEIVLQNVINYIDTQVETEITKIEWIDA